MRSALLDQCFNPEEQEFLSEILEAAVGEGHETVAAHEQDIKDRGDSIIFSGDLTDIQALDRQRRKLKFLELFASCLGSSD